MQRLLLTTSQQFEWIREEFLEHLNVPPGERLQSGRVWRALAWSNTTLESFTGSGILLEEDQTYDAPIRFLDVEM